MRSCQDYLSELRQKIQVAEDHLRAKKKNLYKANELFTEDRDKWNEEIKEEELKVNANEIQIKEKETELDLLKKNYEDTLQMCAKLEADNEKLSRDLQKARTQQEDTQNKFLLEQGSLESELGKILDLQRDLKTSNKWAKVFNEKELRYYEEEQETHLRDELKQLSDELSRKMEAFDENLTDIDRASLAPKRDRLAALREALDRITSECKHYEEKNRTLEEQILQLEKF